jgi:iron complex outermembrane recepter protein
MLAGLPLTHDLPRFEKRWTSTRSRALPSLCFLVGLIGLIAPHPAHAQEPRATDEVLEAVTVTARRREERDLDVPISLSVLSASQLTLSPMQFNADLARAVPNLSYVDVGGQSSNFVNVRGVGSFSPVAADDTSVVFYVDEVPLSVYGTAPNLVDVERVEVLRGPQGTLFGRNTQGGAINVISRAPSFRPLLRVAAEAGTDGYGLGEIVVNRTLTENKLAGRLAVRWSGFGGDIPNVVAGGDDGALDIVGARASVLFTPSARMQMQLTLNVGRENTHSPRFLWRAAPGFPQSATDPRLHVDNRSDGGHLKIEREFNYLRLDSHTSVLHNRSSQLLDLTDGLVFGALSGLPSVYFNTPGVDVQTGDFDETTYLQELRVSSLPTAALAWTGGLNYFRSEFSMASEGRSSTPAYLFINGDQDNRITTDSYAVFGEMTVPFSSRLKITAGVRAGDEEKQSAYVFRSNGTAGVTPYSSQREDLSAQFLTGRAMLSHEWSGTLMSYASVARGYVTAGFPAVSVNNPFGQPEPSFPRSRSWTHELGIKSLLFEQRLRVNASGFFNDVTDGHLVVLDPAVAFFTTAALDYRSWGGELEATARLHLGLDLFAGVGATHAELVDVPANTLSGARSSNDVPNVPRWTSNVGVEYNIVGRHVGLPGRLLARLTRQSVSSRAADVANTFRLQGYDLLNARVTWEHQDFSLYAFGNNLRDVRNEVWGQSFGPVQSVRVGPGRILGLGGSIEF